MQNAIEFPKKTGPDAAEAWLARLDDIGPFAPVQDLMALLQCVPPGVPEDDVALLRDVVERRMLGMKARRQNLQGGRGCGLL